MMRVRIMRPFYWRGADKRLVAGDVVCVPDEDGELWLRHDMAMQDKSDEPAEFKDGKPAPEPEPDDDKPEKPEKPEKPKKPKR
jgi:hypothetical protein